MIYKVLDTNIPLMDATNLLNIGREPGVTVVLPETVLAELDAKKSGFEEVNWQARATARLLANGTVLSMTTTDFGTVSSMDIQGARLELVSLNNYVDSSSEYGGNDRRIIQTAKVLIKNNVSTPKVIAKFKKYEDINNFDWTKLPDKFAIKPSRGLGGGGTIVVKKKLKSGNFLTTSQGVKTIEYFKLYILDNL